LITDIHESHAQEGVFIRTVYTSVTAMMVKKLQRLVIGVNKMTINKWIFCIGLAALLLLGIGLSDREGSAAEVDEQRPRVIVTTDGEIDDRSSFARFLLYTCDFDVIGIVPTNSKWQKDGHGKEWIVEAIRRYEQVLPILRKHQSRYPSADFLRDRIFMGNEDRKFLEGAPPFQDTPGSEFIIQTLLDADPRPVFVPAWGGANTQAQALWKLKQTASASEFQRAVKKIRIYCVSFQDSAGDWIVKNIPEATVVQAGSWYQTWNYHPQPKQPHKDIMSEAWLRENVQTGHGPLGAWYPQKNVSEGDSPSFFELIDNGLCAYTRYTYGGWGGRFQIKKNNWWVDAPDNGSTSHALTRWTVAIQNDFAARMDWCVKSFEEANHPPVVKLAHANDLRARPGSKVKLSATASDPDGNQLTYRWWQYQEAGTFEETISIQNNDKLDASFTLPSDAKKGQSVHIICEVTDDGAPSLTRYQRVVVEVE
jgi:hypothetical protein